METPFYPELAAVVGPTVPDYRGLFLRGYGSQNHIKNNGAIIGNTNTIHASGNLNEIQGDGIREIWGILDTWGGTFQWEKGSGDSVTDGCFQPDSYLSWSGVYAGMTPNHTADWMRFYASRVAPVANENRPINKAVKYLVRASD